MQRNRVSWLPVVKHFFSVCPAEAFLTEPVICYILDGFLVIYCLVITGFLFKEKVSHRAITGCSSVYKTAVISKGVLHSGVQEVPCEELQRPPGTDVYQVLETKGKVSNFQLKNKTKQNITSLILQLYYQVSCCIVSPEKDWQEKESPGQ
uniref:T-cell surface glycoprotein CD3 zeta chain n=1 Tax=Myripristis murdjan TaxID=586833 RepID=A0A667Z0Y3_9TELE